MRLLYKFGGFFASEQVHLALVVGTAAVNHALVHLVSVLRTCLHEAEPRVTSQYSCLSACDILASGAVFHERGKIKESCARLLVNSAFLWWGINH